MMSTAVAGTQFFHGAADHTPELDEALITDDRVRTSGGALVNFQNATSGCSRR